MKNQDIKNGIYKVICFAAKNHNQSFSTPLHLSPPPRPAQPHANSGCPCSQACK